MRAVLPLLLVLICPLMMIFMMRGHGAHGRAAATSEHHDHGAGSQAQSQPPSLDELHALRDELEIRLEQLDERTDDLQQADMERPEKALIRA
jgi:hypothetical protein